MKQHLLKIIKLGQTTTAKNTYLVFIANSIAGLLGMILIILISRTLGPAGFGIFSVSIAFLSMLTSLADFGLNFAMMKDISQSRARGEMDKIARIFTTVFSFKTVISLVIGIVGYFTIGFISSNILRSPQSTYLNRIIVLSCFLFIFYDLVRAYFDSNKRFWESSLLYISANVLKLIAVSLLIFINPSIASFILVYIIAPFFIALFFLKKAKLPLRLDIHLPELKNLSKFASWMAVSTTLSAFGENINIFMVSSKLSSYQAGIYSAADKFIMPFSIFAASISSVLITRTSEFLDISHIKKFLKKVLVVQGLLLALFIVISPFTYLLPFILGKDYSLSVPILQLLLISTFFRVSITILNTVFYPLEKSAIFALDAFISVSCLFLLNQYFLKQFQARGAAISSIIVSVIIFVVNYIFLFTQLSKTKGAKIN